MGLFDKNEKTGTAVTSAPAPRREDDRVRREGEVVQTLIGKGSEFDGKLTFEGQVHIEGKFNGQIHTKDTLVVGQSARVTAEITAGTVVINGTVEGNIKAATLIEIHATGRVKGNLEAPALSIEKGAIFDGSSKMEAGGKGAVAPTPVEAAKK
jgi:cytoskeletal protein CcmA (bactofilin family)